MPSAQAGPDLDRLVGTWQESRANPVGEPVPYLTEEVTLETGDPAVSLGCTLTTPREEGPHPAAMLLTVAGPNDRDQSHFGHRPFFVLADHLTRRGLVILRCDDRGVGDSSGDVTAVGLDVLAEDAVRGARYLAQQEAVDPSAVGFIGNSEGSLVGAKAALASDEVGFVVMLGGVGVPGSELIRERRLADLRRRDVSEEDLQSRMALFDRLIELVERGRGAGLEAARARDPSLIDKIDEVLDSPNFSGGPLFPRERRAQLELLLGPWYHSQLLSDAPSVLRRIRQPVLALAGSVDRVNLPAQNLPAIQQALLEGGNQDHTVALLPRLNHVFQTAKRGGMEEYGRLKESFSSLALRTISDWIVLRFAPE
ncbi:MAG: alpha/beta hydrolase [Thermoanaerobaculia bacterium]|nr:alpha/beta hydrolase [Thermoanaerobaculia bacterium]